MDSKTAHRRICVVGSANVDLTFRTARLPLPGETLAGHSLHQGMGGKGANQAVAAARLGGNVHFIACVGHDGFAEQAIQAYKRDGIDVTHVRKSVGQPTGTAAILVDDDAENCIIVVPGATAELTAHDISVAAASIQESEIILCQLETPVEAAVEAFRLARSANRQTVLTPAPADKVTDELLALTDFCLPNQSELSALVGEPIETQADAIGGAERLRQRGVGTVLLTQGKHGALLVASDGITVIPANSVSAVDTTGAGDAFTAAFAVAVADGMELADAAQFASLSAAISVTRPGTQTSFPTRQEIEDWKA
ncbi:MAG: ribokinase [Planctomycetota bacterium]